MALQGMSNGRLNSRMNGMGDRYNPASVMMMVIQWLKLTPLTTREAPVKRVPGGTSSVS
jgi:hypothetical protein